MTARRGWLALACLATAALFVASRSHWHWPRALASSGPLTHVPIGRLCLGPVAEGRPAGALLPSPVPPLRLHSQVGLAVFPRGCHSSSERFRELPTLRELEPRHWTVEGGFTSEMPAGPTLADCGGGVVRRSIGWLLPGRWEITAAGLTLAFDVPADGSPVVAAPTVVGMPEGWRCIGVDPRQP